MPRSEHPSPTELLAAEQDRAPELAAHLAACEACRRLAALADDPGALPTAGSGKKVSDTFSAASERQRTTGPDTFPELSTVDRDNYSGLEPFDAGRGAMGNTYRARDRRLGRDVVLKEPRVAGASAAERAALELRFAREARFTARLQHPSIVAVYEAGRWSDGRPFYAMPLVRGEPLDIVIAQRRDLRERIALLANVIAAADAIAYAHARGIVHRDIKPANLLVGEFGETLVIDWGLAKAIDAADADAPGDSEPPREPVASDDDSKGPQDALTLLGVGTPHYMPPEQARGDEPDPRVDVYALGATLYHVLAGVPPYELGPGSEVRRSLVSGPPKPLATIAPDVPRELVALVDKAMAREPGNRFPSARELAADLRRFQAGQLVGAHRYSFGELARRWLARHRTAVTISTLAVIVLAVVGVISVQRIVAARKVAEREQQIAVRERGEAIAMRGRADKLVAFMLEDLKASLEPLGRLDLLKAIAVQAGDYYAALPPGPRVDEVRRALQLELIGDVLADEGNTAGALAAYRASQRISVELAKTAPDDASAQRSVAVGRLKLADVLSKRGEREPALAEYRTAIDELAKLATTLEGESDLATARERLSNALSALGDTPGALREARAAREIRARVHRAAPTDANVTLAVAFSAIQIGDLLRDTDGEAALVEYRAAIETVELLASATPPNAIATKLLAESHGRIADVLMRRLDHAGTLVERRLVAQIFERLAAADPTSAVRQRDLAIARAQTGDALAALGRTPEALVELRASLAIRQRLADRDRSNVAAQRDLEVVHDRLGDALLATDPEAARESFATALEIARALAVADPTPEIERDVHLAHFKLGKVDFELIARALIAASPDPSRGTAPPSTAPNRERARTQYDKALELARGLATRDPNPRWLSDVAAIQEARGDLALAYDDWPAAKAAFEDALTIRKQLVTSNDETRHELAGAHNGLADALAGLGDAAAAKREVDAAIAILESLAKAHPDDTQLTAELAQLRESPAALGR